MAIPIIHDWEKYFHDPHEGLGSSYERIVLNDILDGVCAKYNVQSVLESPSFGFTGLSGINLVHLAQKGISIHLQDNNAKRLEMIKATWQEMDAHLECSFNADFRVLDFQDNEFDMSFSFSALWFTQDLATYLRELARITRKVIFISVPNRDGIGYRMQLRDYSPQRYPELCISHIDPTSIRYLLAKHGWVLGDAGYFDCPPWPDFGMAKESFAQRLLGKESAPSSVECNPSNSNPVTIMKYYQGNDPGFPHRMRRFGLVESLAPVWFKRLWAHHYYMVFTDGSHGT